MLLNIFYNQDVTSTFAFTWKSICLPRKLAIFIFSEQKSGVLLTESNVYRKIILASGCFMKIVTVQLVWLFLWPKWAHGYDVRARAKTIIHLLQQTQGFNSYILHLILSSLERLAVIQRVKRGLVPFWNVSVFSLMRQLGSLAKNMAISKLNYQIQLPAWRYNKTLVLISRHP